MGARDELVVTNRAGEARVLEWRSELSPAPRSAITVGDATRADAALQAARKGAALAYEGDWNNAHQLLAAMGRRIRPVRPRGSSVRDAFLAERATRRLEHLLLSRLCVPVGPGWSSPLARAPSLEAPLREAFGPGPDRAALIPLREVLGAIGAYEWFRRGVPVPGLGTVHPRYGVFAPVRNEYVALVARTIEERAGALSLAGARAFDVGTGTGVLALLLARAGAQVTATDVDPRAVASAGENAARHDLTPRIDAVEADLFPPGRARLVVSNPPWVPGEAHGPLDRAVYDPGGNVLGRFLEGCAAHLDERGEAWLILSDFAERVGLRVPGALEANVDAVGLQIVAIRSATPNHPRARAGRHAAVSDPIAAARASETTRLYVLRPRPPNAP